MDPPSYEHTSNADSNRANGAGESAPPLSEQPLQEEPPSYDSEPLKPSSESKWAPPFVRILTDAPLDSFSSYKYSMEGADTSDHGIIPSIPDAVAHLKLLKAFSVMKSRVVEFGDDKETKSKNWQVFITNAVRRFIIFVSCLKVKLGPEIHLRWNEAAVYRTASKKDPKVIRAFREFLPPLDVLMVWHTFLLNPRSYYDNFMRYRFYKFANMPFPFDMVSSAIDNATFEYNPDEKLRQGYFRLLEPFMIGNTPNQVFDLQRFDVSKDFSMLAYSLDVACPICKAVICKGVPYTNDDASGFSDPAFEFEASECPCGFRQTINHDELRKRQMYSDANDTRRFLPGYFKYFSKVLMAKPREFDPKELRFGFKTYIEELLRHETTTLVGAIKSGYNSHYARQLEVIFRAYLHMNLVQATVTPPPKSGMDIFEASEDLVTCVARQEKFVEKMNSIDWLSSDVVKQSLSESIVRYDRFLKFLTRFAVGQSLVPTLDIDLIWHTHQLSAVYYFRSCLSTAKMLPDHNDKVEQARLDRSFEETCKIYRQVFKEEYSLCFCGYCVCVRANTRSKIGKIFKRKGSDTSDKSPLILSELTHVSLHNLTEVPSRSDSSSRQMLIKKYSRSSNVTGEVPWGAYPTQYYYPGIYLADPVTPIGVHHSSFYSACLVVSDSSFVSGKPGGSYAQSTACSSTSLSTSSTTGENYSSSGADGGGGGTVGCSSGGGGGGCSSGGGMGCSSGGGS